MENIAYASDAGATPSTPPPKGIESVIPPCFQPFFIQPFKEFFLNIFFLKGYSFFNSFNHFSVDTPAHANTHRPFTHTFLQEHEGAQAQSKERDGMDTRIRAGA